jgi:hypothetical protein
VDRQGFVLVVALDAAALDQIQSWNFSGLPQQAASRLAGRIGSVCSERPKFCFFAPTSFRARRPASLASSGNLEQMAILGGGGDGDADHARLPEKATTLASVSPVRNDAHASITGRRRSSIELR